jgi:hypothetical protein
VTASAGIPAGLGLGRLPGPPVDDVEEEESSDEEGEGGARQPFDRGLPGRHDYLGQASQVGLVLLL